MSITAERKSPKVGATAVSCKTCYFAQYEGKTQIGCQLGRIEKFRSMGVKIAEAFDTDKEFFVIDGRTCTAFRPSVWATDKTLEENTAQLRREIRFRPDVLIYSNTPTQPKTVLKSLKGVVLDLFKPASIHFVLDQNNICDEQVLWKMAGDKIPAGIPWYVTRLLHANGKLEIALEHLLPKLSAPYFTVVGFNRKMSVNYYKKIDRWLNQDLKRLLFFEDRANGQPLTVQRNALEMYVNHQGERALKLLMRKHKKGLL